MKNLIKKEIIIRSSQQKYNPLPFYETRGSGNNQIILIHGFGLNHKSWYDISPILADKFTIYMVDLIGFGNSPTPENWPYTIEAQAEVLINFIINKKLSDVVIVGHSYGGGVALMLFHKMIENGNSSLVKKLILIAPAAYPQALPFFVTLPRIPFIGRLILKRLSARFQIKMALRKVFMNKKAVTEERVKRYIGNIVSPSHRKALVQTAKNIIPQETDKLLNKIEKIHHRTLLVYGENDSVILKKNLERLSRTLPNVITKKIADCGHVPQEEYPRVTAELISDFL